ncbi:MAG TPA: aminotransferase class I/II-fold pyridoxal phosphate-dependent enzyme [Chitinophagaceae bacterium]|nr:aminotransferase class I/II-fold pyridoxal phosphate-dependent enzyme [Chitinophagaceae bacterium]
MTEVAGRLKHTEEYYFSRKLREIDELNKGGKKVINLGIGNPDMPPHPLVISELAKTAALPSSHGYQGYRGIPALRAAFAGFYHKYYGVDLEPDTEILPLMGSKEGILHVNMTFLDQGDEVLIPNPGYPTYRAAAQLTGATCREYVLDPALHWLPDLEKLESTDLSRVKLMWINYPHMPTGASAGIPVFTRLVDFARRHQILLCHDNPYSFILQDRPLSLLAVPGALEVALELNSLSKSHNMAGWRVGMLAGSAPLVQDVLRFKSNMDSGMFLPVQLAATVALGLGMDWFDELNLTYRQRRTLVFELLDFTGCRYDPAQSGLFVWARIPGDYADGFAFSDHLLYGAGVFVTPGGIFGSQGNSYIRVSLCRESAILEESMQRLAALKNKGSAK